MRVRFGDISSRGSEQFVREKNTGPVDLDSLPTFYSSPTKKSAEGFITHGYACFPWY